MDIDIQAVSVLNKVNRFQFQKDLFNEKCIIKIFFEEKMVNIHSHIQENRTLTVTVYFIVRDNSSVPHKHHIKC